MRVCNASWDTFAEIISSLSVWSLGGDHIYGLFLIQITGSLSCNSKVRKHFFIFLSFLVFYTEVVLILKLDKSYMCSINEDQFKSLFSLYLSCFKIWVFMKDKRNVYRLL